MPTSWENSPKIIDSYIQSEALFESMVPSAGWWPFALLEVTALFFAVGVNLDPGALWPIPGMIGP